MPTICQRYRRTDGRTDRRTDGRTDERLTIAIPRFALRASRGKNQTYTTKYSDPIYYLSELKYTQENTKTQRIPTSLSTRFIILQTEQCVAHEHFT